MRFLLGGRHGEFKFLPPPGYAPCHEAVLPRERLHLEPIKEYRREGPRGPHLVGPSRCLSHTDFVPCPVDTVQVLHAPQEFPVRQTLLGVKEVGNCAGSWEPCCLTDGETEEEWRQRTLLK